MRAKARTVAVIGRFGRVRNQLVVGAVLLIALAFAATPAPAAPPTATIDPVGTVSMTTAEVSGEINPADTETYYCFQTSFEAEPGVWSSWSDFCFEGPISAGAGPTAVPTDSEYRQLTGLRAGHNYKVRLTAWNLTDPEVLSSEETFTTDPFLNTPSVSLDPATFSYTIAKLEGSFNPNGGNDDPVAGTLPIAWELQTSETGDPNTWGYANGNVLEGAEAKGTASIDVSADLSGLPPNTPVHYRLLLVTGATEFIAGPDQFTTLAVAAPGVTIDPVTEFTATTAHLTGDVDPQGTDEAFNANWHFEYATQPDFSDARSVEGGTVAGSPDEVEADLVKLQPNRTYYVRLKASNLGGETTSTPDPSFTTPPIAPAVQTMGAGAVNDTNAVIHGQVDPKNSETDYWFEWGTANCASNSCTAIPLGEDADAGSGFGFVHVSRELTGLAPQATYHYRLLAENAVGTTEGEDRTFTTGASPAGCPNAGPGVGFLSNCRAWEMVSPQDKNGGDILRKADRTHAALTGGAIAFTSLQGFGDVHGMGVAAEYIAQRTGAPGTSGWSTHAITPLQEAMNIADHFLGLETMYEWVMSPDLNRGIFLALTPLTPDPYVADTFNYYLRDDLRTPGAGSFELLSSCPACEASDTPIPPSRRALERSRIAGASPDLGHVLFEDIYPLTPDAPSGASNLFEFDHGDLRLAGILPSGSPAPSSVAGNGVTQAAPKTKYVTNPISDDGARIVYTADIISTLLGGTLYQRINHATTIPLTLSERAVPDSPQPARYWDSAVKDGSRVFFTSFESLTEDAPIDGGKLYMWEKQTHNEEQSLAVDAGGGTFTLTFNERTTGAIPYDASADAVQSALEQLKGPPPLEHQVIGEGNVSVSGGPGSPGAPAPYEITFTGNFAGANVAELEADGSQLNGGASTAAVTTSVPVENLTLLSVDEEPADGSAPDVKGVIGSSDDGRYVYFVAPGQLVSGKPLINGDPAIYLWHDGEITYVGRASRYGPDAYSMHDGNNFATGQKDARVTPDGRHLLFMASSGTGLLSAHGGADYDHGPDTNQLYLYSADSDELECASCIPSGAPATASATDQVSVNSGGVRSTPKLSNPLSEDGRYAFFTSAERLVPADTNGVSDAYVYDSLAAEPRLLSSGRSSTDSYFMDASADGGDAFILTTERLSGWDIDRAYDFYDARTGGGFPEPPPPPPSCQGDACQPAPLSLNDPTPTSSGFQGPGNETRKPGPRCPQGKRPVKRKGKTRCVTKSKKRDANANRRASR